MESCTRSDVGRRYRAPLFSSNRDLLRPRPHRRNRRDRLFSEMFRSALYRIRPKNVLPPSCQLTASVMGKKGDQDDDRDRYSKQPKKNRTAHDFFLSGADGSNRVATCYSTFHPGDRRPLLQQDQRRLRSEGIELATGQGGRRLACIVCSRSRLRDNVGDTLLGIRQAKTRPRSDHLPDIGSINGAQIPIVPEA
jgi:hypothetical protein